MIGPALSNPRLAVHLVVLSLLLGLTTGCLEKRLQWSPDGDRAAVITSAGLFLADADGSLEPIASPVAVHALAWLSDSKRMVIAAKAGSDESVLAVARISGSELIVGDIVYSGSGVVDIRVGSGDRVFSFTVEDFSVEEAAAELRLYAAPMDGSRPPQLVSDRAAAYPDWSADGRSLFYVEASEGSGGDERLRLASLLERELVDSEGAFSLAPASRTIAGLVFEPYARVRTLSDNRLLFNATEFELPYSTLDFGGRHPQLYMALPDRQPKLVPLIPRHQQRRLPEYLGFFEVSPDETAILFGTTTGEVVHLTLATGVVEVIQPAAAAEMKVAPVWREPGEFTYIRIPDSEAVDLRAAAVVLQRPGETRVLSADWPAELLDDLLADRE